MPPSSFPREKLRLTVRNWQEPQRRIALERIIEYLPDDQLAVVLEDLARLNAPPVAVGAPLPTLIERVASHATATRCGEYLGGLSLRNEHGQRDPWQTHAWDAATWHLFDLALKRAAENEDRDAITALRMLVELVEEVTERIDELVVFEDSSAGAELDHQLRRAQILLST